MVCLSLSKKKLSYELIPTHVTSKLCKATACAKIDVLFAQNEAMVPVGDTLGPTKRSHTMCVNQATRPEGAPLVGRRMLDEKASWCLKTKKHWMLVTYNPVSGCWYDVKVIIMLFIILSDLSVDVDMMLISCRSSLGRCVEDTTHHIPAVFHGESSVAFPAKITWRLPENAGPAIEIGRLMWHATNVPASLCT